MKGKRSAQWFPKLWSPPMESWPMSSSILLTWELLKKGLQSLEISRLRKRFSKFSGLFKAFLFMFCWIFQALILGAGYVSAPVVDYLTRDHAVGVTVAAALMEDANKLARRWISWKKFRILKQNLAGFGRISVEIGIEKVPNLTFKFENFSRGLHRIFSYQASLDLPK